MMSMIIGLILYRLLVIVFLLLLTVFFTASETSLTVLRRSQIKRLIKDKGLAQLNTWLKDPNRLLTTMLIGTAVCVVGISVMGATIALDISRKFNVPELIAIGVSTALVIIIVLVFGEIVPKAFARRNAEKVSASIIGPLRAVNLVFTPLVMVFTFITDAILRIFGGKPLKEQPLFNFEELKGLIEMGVREGVIAKTEKKMLSQIMEFEDTVVREIMVPRIDVKALNIRQDKKELLSKAIEFRHSRIPVYRDSIDDIMGILYVKDLLPALMNEKDINIEKILRKPYFVPETKRINDLLREFRQGREHIAVVVDEYGDSTGLVTIEDVVEEITGEILDEYDVKKNTIVKIEEGKWQINAAEDLDKINDELELEFPEDEYDSLGGLIVGEFGRVPKIGEVLDYKGYKLVIHKATPNRVVKVRLEKR
ncbi:MAG: hemolysin family protein [Elusimicrobiota bacterium]